MRRLCRAANLAEAYILRGLLEQAGIDCAVFNEHAQGGVGQLPVPDALPELWVEAPDLDRAAALLEDFRRKPASGAARACPACHEESPGNFQVCWNCSAPL